MYYLPPLVFLGWALYCRLKLPDWRNVRYVRKSQRRVWGFWHILDDDEWTEEGLRLRRSYFVHAFVGIAVAALTVLIVSFLSR